MPSRNWGKSPVGQMDWPGRHSRRPDEVAIGTYRGWIVPDVSFLNSALRFVIFLDWIVSNESSSVR
jgi:hypothetical protein